MILETTMASRFEPGSNLKGQVTGASWLFLLPRLDLRQVACVGTPPASTLRALARVSQAVCVLCPSAAAAGRVKQLARQLGLVNVRALVPDLVSDLTSDLAPGPGTALDLVFVVPGAGARWLARRADLAHMLARALGPDGLAYGEATRWQRAAGLPAPLRDQGLLRCFQCTPLWGEMRTALPAGDEAMARFFRHHQLETPLSQRAPLASLERRLARRLPVRRWADRRGLLLERAGQAGAGPPAWLCALAEQAGVTVADCRWGLVASGLYASRKVLFYLLEPDGQSPRYVVKLTRDPAYNARLENEERALAHLAALGLADADVLPRPAFFGYHAGLVVLGQTALVGQPFSSRSALTAECPLARAALRWLEDLAVATADPSGATPAAVGAALGALYERFAAIYTLTDTQHAVLGGAIAELAGGAGPLPTVFQHGDPGAWNALALPDGRAAFVDWEAAEAHGLPLWDLLYFLRSFAVRAARRRGQRDTLAAATEAFLRSADPLHGMVRSAVASYVARVGLDPAHVAPLFLTCWMHRALKESTRLAPGRLQHGHYARLVRHYADHWQAAGLEWLRRTDGAP